MFRGNRVRARKIKDTIDNLTTQQQHASSRYIQTIIINHYYYTSKSIFRLFLDVSDLNSYISVAGRELS